MDWTPQNSKNKRHFGTWMWGWVGLYSLLQLINKKSS
jgi:hypothetical protein